MGSRSRTYASPNCDQTRCTMLVSEGVSVSCQLATLITKIDSGTGPLPRTGLLQ